MGRRSRGSYWSSGAVANWIVHTFTDIQRPASATMLEWRRWHADFKTRYPIVYWVVEDFFDSTQNAFMWTGDMLDDIRYTLYNRFVAQPHVLHTRLKKGQYYEVDTRMLHGLFETLVDFIEVEKAWHRVAWDQEARAKYKLPWYKRVPYWLRWKEWRCPEAGIDHLQWEMTLTHDYEWLPEEEQSQQPTRGMPTPQAESAKEQLELYTWWKNVRPARPDPMDEGGWSEYCDNLRRKHGDMWIGMDEENTDDEREAGKLALDKTHTLETAYEQEDDAMLIRLIKLRRHLWT